MTLVKSLRSVFPGLLSILVVWPTMTLVSQGAESPPSRRNLREPVYRVANRASLPEKQRATVPPRRNQAPDRHPLDPALDMARQALERIDRGIRDYTCEMVKQEQVNGTVLEPEKMFIKIRNRRVEGDRVVVPFSVYMKFVYPASVKGREVIYVEHQNSGKLVAHEGGIKGKFLPTVWLKPDSALAMRNNRYPITEIGVVTLARRLIERGELDRKYPDCEVKFYRGAKINKRTCTCVQVQHKSRRPEFDFFVARIFIDDELGIPVRYIAYDWPVAGSSSPKLIESYTYLNVKVNVGLTDQDFNYENPSYNF